MKEGERELVKAKSKKKIAKTDETERNTNRARQARGRGQERNVSPLGGEQKFPWNTGYGRFAIEGVCVAQRKRSEAQPTLQVQVGRALCVYFFSLPLNREGLLVHRGLEFRAGANSAAGFFFFFFFSPLRFECRNSTVETVST